MTTVIEKPMIQPVIVAAGESRTAEPIRLMGQEIRIKVSGKDTRGNFAAGHLTVEPMCGPPLHVHSREDEWFYILKGEFTFEVDGNRVIAGPGSSIFAPRGIPHTFQNFTGSPIEALVMITPADLERFFMEASAAQLSPQDIAALFEPYGMTLLGPSLAR